MHACPHPRAYRAWRGGGGTWPQYCLRVCGFRHKRILDQVCDGQTLKTGHACAREPASKDKRREKRREENRREQKRESVCERECVFVYVCVFACVRARKRVATYKTHSIERCWAICQHCSGKRMRHTVRHTHTPHTHTHTHTQTHTHTHTQIQSTQHTPQMQAIPPPCPHTRIFAIDGREVSLSVDA